MAFALPVWFLAQQELLSSEDDCSGIFDDFDDEALFDFFHLNRPCISFIADTLRGRIAPLSERDLSADAMVMVTLNYLAHGVSSPAVLQRARLSHEDNPSVICAVCAALADMCEQFVSFPLSAESREHLALKTERLCGIPGVLGVLAPVHFKIRASPYEKDTFRSFVNSVGFTSVVSQLICDYDGNVLSVEHCCGGSAFEQDLWESSCKGKEMEGGVHGSYWVLGGSGYFQSKHVLTPVSEPKNEREVFFNRAHARIYNVMQATLSSMRRRFRCLLQLGFVHDSSLEKKFNVIKACVVLHNISKKFSVPPPAVAGKPELLQTGKLPSRLVTVDQEAWSIRKKLIDSKFAEPFSPN
ncbi:putative nuclease HARBI1 [Synchiropus picturatus]